LAQDAATVSQLQTAGTDILADVLNLTGGVMTGAIDMGNNLIQNVSDPVDPQDAVNKQTLTTSLNSYLPLSGGTMSGSINMDGSVFMQNLPTPILPNDAVSKSYVDNIASNITWKPACRLLGNTGLNATYNHGPNFGQPGFEGDVGANFTCNDPNEVLQLDGFTVDLNDIVLITGYAMENGIYDCTQINNGTDPWILTRNQYFNGDPLASEVKPGDIVYVSQGSTF
jgi:hypothetical protein